MNASPCRDRTTVKLASAERGDAQRLDSLGDCDDRGVRAAERQAGVLADQFAHALQVFGIRP
ncbi:hypothetical protein ACWDA7_42350 [Streptomyces sp. NPDC001156]